MGAPVVKSLLESLLRKSRPKINFSKFVQNHLETTQEHPGGVFDDLGPAFWTPGSRSVWDSVVKTE